jgi:hypothetical protein
MSQAKATFRRKRRRKAAPVLGAAGLSLSLASGASTALGATNADMHTCSVSVSHELVLREEEFTDLSLATFHIFEKESTPRPVARISAGCGACGADLYSNQPASSPPASRPSPLARKPPRSYVNAPKHPQIPKSQNQNTSRAAEPKAGAPTKNQNATQQAQPVLEGAANQNAGQQAQPEVASPVTNAPN